jgi:NAD/NADP transhydrogenase alpha subunit
MTSWKRLGRSGTGTSGIWVYRTGVGLQREEGSLFMSVLVVANAIGHRWAGEALGALEVFPGVFIRCHLPVLMICRASSMDVVSSMGAAVSTTAVVIAARRCK